jgi:hypothetical protein
MQSSKLRWVFALWAMGAIPAPVLAHNDYGSTSFNFLLLRVFTAQRSMNTLTRSQ